MASTNTNTNSETVLSTDIYEIADFYDQIRIDHIPDVDETSSIVGIFGYMNEMFSQTLQNTLIVVSETTNETIPTRAKFSKNIISHALNFGVNDIYAKPAVMTMMLYLPVSYVESNFVENATSPDDNGRYVSKFILSAKVPIFVNNYEFHLDYDVVITRIGRVIDNKMVYTYTAKYDITNNAAKTPILNNPISDITNPYITTLVQANMNNTDYIAFSARLHQVIYDTEVKNVLTSNVIENKTMTFEFQGQLAAFDVDIIENNKTTHLTPVYNGLLDYTVDDDNWCFYEYVDANTIRVMFSRDAYVPGMNATVVVNKYLSSGASGNFTYNNSFRTALICEEYNNYGGMYAIVYPLLNGLSSGGKDAKTVSELKKIIPREASSRGSIINTTDLNNFFNSINDTECKLYFKKKRDNPFERLYYAYMLMKKDGNVYPTNTISLKLQQTDFIGHAGNNNLSINPGTVFYYYNHGTKLDVECDYASINPPEYFDSGDDTIDYPVTINEDDEYARVYQYISPFLITIDDDLIASYFLTIMNENKMFRFGPINEESDLQFVATNLNWVRNFYVNDDEESVYDNKYTLTVDITQNNQSDYGLIKYHIDANGDMIFDDIRTKVYFVFYADETETNPYRYAEATLEAYDPHRYVYSYKLVLETDDLMDLNNRINIKGIYNAKPEELQKNSTAANSHGYMNKNTFVKMFIMADFGTKAGDKIQNSSVTVTEETAEVVVYGNRTDIENVIPTRADLVKAFLANDIYTEGANGELVNVVSIIRNNPNYIQVVMDANGDDKQTATAILKYIRNNINSEFVQNVLLKDSAVEALINEYHWEEFSRYTLCNILSVEDGIDFYHDYSKLMTSTITVKQVQQTDANGNLLYKEVEHTDSAGNSYIEYVPIYKTNENGLYQYEYTIDRIPVIKNGYLSNEELVQDFVYDIEERRHYIEECLYVLEDTFGIDLKFVNAFGPSRTFYYNIPSNQNYKVKVSAKQLKVYRSTVDEDDESMVTGVLMKDQVVTVIRVRGQWGYVLTPYEGWIKLADTAKFTNFIDNVSITLKFALEAQTAADRNVDESIIQDVKEYIEDINEINELHIPNIITLITNNYREQLVYFEFLDVNGYGPSCQHLYLLQRDPDIADIAPEFINVAISEDDTFTPLIDVTVY